MPELEDDDDEYDNIIADYAAGHDVADIEERYNVSRAEIEWLVAEDARYEAAHAAPGSAPRTVPPAPGPVPVTSPPVPVLIAVVLLGLGAAAQLAGAVILVVAGAWVLAPCVTLGIAVDASAAYGLWRGWRGAQVVAVVLGAILLLGGAIQLGNSDFGFGPMVVGAALALLVLVPASARAWFAR